MKTHHVSRDELCPACGKPAHYILATDRYSHADGSENASCWTAILRKQTVEPVPGPSGYDWLNHLRRGR